MELFFVIGGNLLRLKSHIVDNFVSFTCSWLKIIANAEATIFNEIPLRDA